MSAVHPLTPQAECCYVEVEVEGDWVEIILAYKGIDIFGGNVNS